MSTFIRLPLSFFYFLLLFIVACGQNETAGQPPEPVVTDTTTVREALSGADLDSAAARTALGDLPDKVVDAIADKRFDELARYVHPAGLRISPYAYIDTAGHQVLSRQQIAALPDNTKRLWGHQDGSGEPIQLTFSEYYDRYIYDRPYAQADTVGYNQVIGGGNTINNYREVYPESVMVEYYLPGSNPDYGGMDWGSLILVFTPHEGQWYLRSLAHGQWTI